MRRIVHFMLALAIGLALMSPTSAVLAADNDTALGTSDRVLVVRRDANGVGTNGSVPPAAIFEDIGLGYATGAGGAVTQATSRTTGVTLNANSGAITLVSAAGSATPASFTVTNSKIAATDTIILNQKSGTDLLELHVTDVSAGSFQVTFFTTGGTTTEQPVINFAVIKAAAD